MSTRSEWATSARLLRRKLYMRRASVNVSTVKPIRGGQRNRRHSPARKLRSKGALWATSTVSSVISRTRSAICEKIGSVCSRQSVSPLTAAAPGDIARCGLTSDSKVSSTRPPR